MENTKEIKLFMHMIAMYSTYMCDRLCEHVSPYDRHLLGASSSFNSSKPLFLLRKRHLLHFEDALVAEIIVWVLRPLFSGKDVQRERES